MASPPVARVAVLGGRGMLGSDVVQALRSAGSCVRAWDLPECDITDEGNLRLALEDVDAVVNCAAFTNVDGAESAAEAAGAVNRDAPGRLGKLAADRGLYAVHISTDFVFDGELDRPYREEDEARPLSVYGSTKLAGERAFLESGCAGGVLRVQWTYGEHGNHFVSKFLSRAERTDDLMMVDDQVGAPTWTRYVSEAIAAMLRKRASGLFHYAAAGYATRFEVAAAILQIRGLEGKTLVPCRTADFVSAARRPLNSRFDCSKVDSVLQAARPHWRTALTEFLRHTGRIKHAAPQ